MRFFKRRIAPFVLLLAFILTIPTQAKEVALTIDDLPFVGKIQGDPGKYRREHKRFMAILEALHRNQVPAMGFAVAGAIEPGQWEWLESFKRAGNMIGNHSYSHRSLNRTPVTLYIEDVKKADAVLTPLMSSPKYYRFPYLAEGAGTKKYAEFREYLFANNYVPVPVTIDSNDFGFNLKFVNIPWKERQKYTEDFRRRYLNHIWMKTVKAENDSEKKVHRPIKHILLIHMNTLNAYFLEDIINLYRSHGYRFITVPEALKDPYYTSDVFTVHPQSLYSRRAPTLASHSAAGFLVLPVSSKWPGATSFKSKPTIFRPESATFLIK